MMACLLSCYTIADAVSSESIKSSIKLLDPVKVSKVSDIDFGLVLFKGNTKGLDIAIGSANNTAFSANDSAIFAGSHSRGEVKVRGQANESILVNYPSTEPAILKDSNGNGVPGAQLLYDMSHKNSNRMESIASSSSTQLNSLGEKILYIGARLIAKNVSSGNYTVAHNFSVDVDYK